MKSFKISLAVFILTIASLILNRYMDGSKQVLFILCTFMGISLSVCIFYWHIIYGLKRYERDLIKALAKVTSLIALYKTFKTYPGPLNLSPETLDKDLAELEDVRESIVKDMIELSKKKQELVNT